MSEPKPYPIDVRALVKGQTITVPELEKILGVTIENPDWWARVLILKKKIIIQRARLGLPYFTLNQRGWHGGLHVCTDSEATKYTSQRAQHGKRTFRNALRGKLAVDVSQLTDDEKKDHEVTLKRMAFEARAWRKASREAIPELAAPPERTTPKMIQGENEGS